MNMADCFKVRLSGLSLKRLLVLVFALAFSHVFADSYKWICPKCGKAWWTSSPLDNRCPKCSWYGNQSEHRVESPSSTFPGETSNDTQIRWNGRHAVQEASYRHSQNFSNFWQGIMNRQIEENNLRAQYIASEDFDFLAALRQKYSSFPEGTRVAIDFMAKGGWFTPNSLARLGNRKRDAFDYVVYMANALQTGGWEQALEKFWKEFAQTVSVVPLDTAGKLVASFQQNMYTYIAVLVVKPYDTNFSQNHGHVMGIQRQALVRAGINPQRLDGVVQRAQQANAPQNQQQFGGFSESQQNQTGIWPQFDEGEDWDEESMNEIDKSLEMYTYALVGNVEPIAQPHSDPSWDAAQTKIDFFDNPDKATGSVTITEEYLKRHLSKIKSKTDALALKMTKDALKYAQQNVNETYAYCIGKSFDCLSKEYFMPYDDAIEGEWLSREMLTYDQQELYAAMYWALCVSSIFDPDYSSKYEKSLGRISQ